MQTQHIIAYLENKLSPEDRRAFENLLDGSEELKQTLEEVRFIWNATDELKMHKQIDAAKNWKELSRRIKVDKYKKKLWFFVRNAAALLFIPIIIISIVLFKEIQERDNVPVEQIELTSANGLVTKVILLDGSEVWLNSGSKLSYPQRFIGDTRDVFLSGEAYFKVNSNQTNRFVVSVEDGLYVSAYGTEFNVSAYKEEQTIEATLVSGNIEVGLFAGEIAGATKVLHGQQVVFNKENRQVTIADINIAVETSWKDGKMIFRRAGMKDVMRSLSRRFNVDIHLDGEELHDYEYSATFTTETLDEILYLLEKTAPIKTKIIYPEQIDDYAFTKRKVIISMRR